MSYIITPTPTVTPYSGQQLSVTDWLENIYNPETAPPLPTMEKSYTRTRTIYFPDPESIRDTNKETRRANINAACMLAYNFLLQHNITPENMPAQYDKFFIPKASGGMREINAPKPELMAVMRQIKDLLHIAQPYIHNAAFAYVEGRSTRDALAVHQANGSKWFLKLDLKDFFTSCNGEYLMRQLTNIHPYTLVSPGTLNWLIALCMLNGGLPQGTPLSPYLTNITMVPIDYKLNLKLHTVDGANLVYTRYADDLLISSTQDFDWRKVIQIVKAVLREERAPFTIKDEKTRYGSAAGRNWNLGLMLNKDNQITIGHKQKQRLRAGINNFLRDFTNGIIWTTIDTQQLMGNLSYLHSIEPDYCSYIIRELEQKYHKNFKRTCKEVFAAGII